MSGIRGSEAGRDGGSGVRGAPLSCLHLINSASHFLKITLAGTKKTRCTVLAHEPMLESQGGGNGSMGGGAGEDFECTAVSANKLLLKLCVAADLCISPPLVPSLLWFSGGLWPAVVGL